MIPLFFIFLLPTLPVTYYSVLKKIFRSYALNIMKYFESKTEDELIWLNAHLIHANAITPDTFTLYFPKILKQNLQNF